MVVLKQYGCCKDMNQYRVFSELLQISQENMEKSKLFASRKPLISSVVVLKQYRCCKDMNQYSVFSELLQISHENMEKSQLLASQKLLISCSGHS